MNNYIEINLSTIKFTDYSNYKELREDFHDGICCLQREEVTIVVLTYGRLEKTIECVDSILKYTDNVNYILYLIDNGTEDNSVLDYYKKVSCENKYIFRITKNRGGSFALNRVISYVRTPYCAIVSNDIVVTKHWLSNLLLCIKSDRDIGMVCPVSTNISNGQDEDLGGFQDIVDMQQKALEFNVSNPRKWKEMIRLVPTVELHKTEIYETVGKYDYGFIHDFGDDDYSYRLRQEGYRLVLCRDTFVHHNHDWSERDAESDKKSIAGRENFKKKHHGLDAWVDFNNHMPDFNADIVEMIQDYSAKSLSILAIDVRCGTPVLDFKNIIRETGCDIECIFTAYTTEIKYYSELKKIREIEGRVYYGDIENIDERDFNRFDFIICGEPINRYKERKDNLLDSCYNLLVDDGKIILRFVEFEDNTDNSLNKLGGCVLSDCYYVFRDFVKDIQRIGFSIISHESKRTILENMEKEMKELIDFYGTVSEMYRNSQIIERWFMLSKTQ